MSALPKSHPGFSVEETALYTRLSRGTIWEHDPLFIAQARTARWSQLDRKPVVLVRSRSVAGRVYAMDPETGAHVGRGCFRSNALHRECNHTKAALAFVESER